MNEADSNKPLAARIYALRGKRADKSAGKGASPSGIAFDMMVPIGVGMFLGYWLDRWTGWKPAFLMLGLLFGMVAGVRSAMRANARFAEREKDAETER